MVRAKFQLQEIRQLHYNKTAQTFVFRPVCDDGIPENARFAKYTPSGEFTMHVDNPVAQEKFKLGESYYVDFTPALPATLTES
jgi:hypothetical protein